MARDPVCGMHVDEETAAARREHDGVTHYFCSVGCMQRFDDDPAKFETGTQSKLDRP